MLCVVEFPTTWNSLMLSWSKGVWKVFSGRSARYTKPTRDFASLHHHETSQVVTATTLDLNIAYHHQSYAVPCMTLLFPNFAPLYHNIPEHDTTVT